MNIVKNSLKCFLLLTCCVGLGAQAVLAKTILDLQKFSKSTSYEWEDDNKQKGHVKLTDLNDAVGAWYIYEIQLPGSINKMVVHIENPLPKVQKLSLIKGSPQSIEIIEGKKSIKCDLFSSEITAERDKSLKVNDPYTGICGNKLYLRNRTPGRQSAKEFVVDFLRNNIWGGEAITSFVKDNFFSDRFLLGSIEKMFDKKGKKANETKSDSKSPMPALVDSKHEKALLKPQHLGLQVVNMSDGQMVAGEWYKIKTYDDVYVSVIQAKLIDESIFNTNKDMVLKLDNVENSALSYMVAYDLSKYDVFFSLGTDHPGVGWSQRTRDSMKDSSIPGPDGIGSIDPLVSTGKINPLFAKQIVSAFTGGFKRSHGAFKWGPLSEINKSSHYGFIEEGVTFSTLTPNLSTLYITHDGTVKLKTWQDKDNSLLPSIRYARQNGVPIIDGVDSKTGLGIPGKFVNKWGPGNWSGSEQSQQRALRAAVCLQENAENRYLIYGYFSSVTSNAMARIFQAYKCNYAMHLDMNALEHTYLAFYSHDNENYKIEHLITGMDVLDSTYKGKTLPRFVGMADNRDFFYLMRK